MSAPTVTAAETDVDGTTLTVTYSEGVAGVTANQYTLNSDHTLSNPVGNQGGAFGDVWTFTISPAVADSSEVLTLDYGGASTQNSTNDLLATFSDFPVTNNVPPADVTAPTATLTLHPNVTAAGGTTYDFTVTYADNVAVDVATLGTGDVTVSGPNAFSATPTFVSVTGSGNGTPRVATYRLTPPGGAWDASDNGTYTISVVAGEVADTAGNPVAAATLGTFTVDNGNLITSSRAQQNASLAALATSNADQLAALITTASEAIRQACCRDFNLQTYTEYYSGGNYPNQLLELRQFPVTAIDRVATAPAGAIKITNGSTANQRATVATTETGLVLVRVASAAKTTNTLLFEDYPTLTELADAVTALGNGWSATVVDNYGLWPSADLKSLQGAVSAIAPLGGAVLELYIEEIGPLMCWDGEGWGMGDVPPQAGWRLDPETSMLFGFFPRGILNLRVDYTAGYANIPEPIQQACVFLAADMYAADQRDGALKSAALGPFRWEIADGTRQLVKSPKIMSLIAPYIDYAARQGRHP